MEQPKLANASAFLARTPKGRDSLCNGALTEKPIKKPSKDWKLDDK